MDDDTPKIPQSLNIAGFLDDLAPKVPRLSLNIAGFLDDLAPKVPRLTLNIAGFLDNLAPKIPRSLNIAGYSDDDSPKIPRSLKHHFVKRNYEFWRKVLHKVLVFFVTSKHGFAKRLLFARIFA